ncbi:hypothetical protein [Paraferrimonas sedimenticola]|nr:hypothetical protein [Paraferrimonas sedimenticola]
MPAAPFPTASDHPQKKPLKAAFARYPVELGMTSSAGYDELDWYVT